METSVLRHLSFALVLAMFASTLSGSGAEPPRGTPVAQKVDGAFAEAEAATRGEVSVVGVAHAFPEGRIDWLFNPTGKGTPFNPEWTWQLNRMYFWGALAQAYEATDDERYAQAFVRQFTDWFAQTGGIPPERDYNRVGSPWRTISSFIA